MKVNNTNQSAPVDGLAGSFGSDEFVCAEQVRRRNMKCVQSPETASARFFFGDDLHPFPIAAPRHAGVSEVDLVEGRFLASACILGFRDRFQPNVRTRKVTALRTIKIIKRHLRSLGSRCARCVDQNAAVRKRSEHRLTMLNATAPLGLFFRKPFIGKETDSALFYAAASFGKPLAQRRQSAFSASHLVLD